MQRWKLLLPVLAALASSPVAHAENANEKVTRYENEARELGANLPKIGVATTEPPRRLVDAQVAFALGDYDAAALMLFDLAAKPGAEQESARYYLGESLYAKRDRGAARGYFAQIVDSGNTSSKYYQPSLLRLIEIAISTQDTEDIATVVGKLDGLGTTQTAEATYVRGKLAFADGKHDEAIQTFARVPAGSDHELQAKYYTATVYVAKKDLDRATTLFTELVDMKPRTANDRRVIELSQMAMGRLFYEKDQFAKSIDAYLLVDRRSDLFPDALYEVAWVYVKNKQFDKALRALELLALSEPTSTKTPTVRILEGNLRIRKAQILRQRIIEGTVRKDDEDATKTPDEEYAKAEAVFMETHDTYHPSYVALAEMVDTDADPTVYLSQIAGRSPELFETTAQLPEAAAAYLAEEPGVQRAVRVAADLNEVRNALALSEDVLARLEALVSADDKTAIYPVLAGRRARIGEIQDDLNKLRGDLNDQQAALAGNAGDLPQLTAQRRQLQQEYDTKQSVETMVSAARETTATGITALEEQTLEVSGALDSTQAMAVAIRTYSNSISKDPATSLTAEDTASVSDTLAAVQTEGAAINAELEEIQREMQYSRDLASAGDQTIARQREVRTQLITTLSTEHRVLAGFATSDKARGLSQLGEKATKLAEQLAQLEATLDQMATRGMQDTKIAITTERANISQIRTELAEAEAQSRELSGTVLGKSFKEVKERFYDIVIRSDVGTTDVAWSQKEDADDDLKRLNLSRQREVKQLRDEFRGILEGQLDTPTTPAPAPVEDTPTPTPPAGSPDSGEPGRVTPGSPDNKPTAPTVKPGTP